MEKNNVLVDNEKMTLEQVAIKLYIPGLFISSGFNKANSFTLSQSFSIFL